MFLSNKTTQIILIAVITLFTAVFGGEDSDQRVGKPAPSFELPKADQSGNLSLDALRGSVVIVDFWASWCGPCRKSLPHLQSLEAKYKDLKVLTVNIDDKEKNAFDFIEEHGLELTVLMDRQKTVVEAYNVSSMPTALLIDRKGIVRFVHSGYTERHMEQLEEEIISLLQ